MAAREQYPHLADAAAIERWAEGRIEARSDFPRLLRRLIVQTNDQFTAVEMRAGTGTDLPGFDGRVEAVKATPLVPVGLSVWELGVGESPQSKAKKDYEKRTKDSLGVDKTKATFVFATGRRWPGKTKWANDRRAEDVWKDVKAFDADDIETAFEISVGNPLLVLGAGWAAR